MLLRIMTVSYYVYVHGKSLQLCPTLCDPTDCSPARLLCPWDFPGKNTGVNCQAFPQGIFPAQGSNPCLMSPALAGGFFTTSTTWEALWGLYIFIYSININLLMHLLY